MRRIVFLSLALIIACAAAPALPAMAEQTGRVEGRVMYKEQPVEGAGVYAYREPESLFAKPPVVRPAVSDASGRFVLELPRGKYFLAATKKGTGTKEVIEAGDYYSFYGGNPVDVDPKRPAKLTLNLAVKPAPQEDTASDGERSGVEGVVAVNGEPLDGAVLFVYLDANDYFRGLGYYMSPPTGVNGSFKLRLPEGTYYIIARKRMGGGVAGPLKEGDFFGYLDTNPVVVRKGLIKHVTLPMVRKVEKGTPGAQGRTAVEGVIVDPSGKPVQGAYACLYKKSEMVDRPAHVSAPTGPDGKFAVELPLGGTFYVGARSVIGSPIEPGQLWGRYSGNPEHSVTVETGEVVKGLEVKVDKVE